MDDRIDAETLKSMSHDDIQWFECYGGVSRLTWGMFENADLGGLDLHDVDFGESELRGASFMGADLRCAAFRGDLRNVDFRGANMGGVDFADLSGNIDDGPVIIDETTKFDKEQLESIRFISGARVTGQDWSGANLSNCFIERSVLRVDLRGAQLPQNMKGVDLRGTKIDGPELSRDGLNLDGAIVDKDIAAKIAIFVKTPPQGLIVDKDYSTKSREPQKPGVSVRG